MTTRTILLPEDELDRRVTAFEAAWHAGESVEVRPFLPDRQSGLFSQVLAELIRIDLEFRFARGESPSLDSYRTLAPECFNDPPWLRELAFEEYRQRQTQGESVDREEYRIRYRIDVENWPVSDGTERPSTELNPGEVIGSFRILSELGRGAFGQVYLAEQLNLAGRHVALKLSTRLGIAEPDTLARLQHTHIVPIYSAERRGRIQTIVMPYLGSTTLADVIETLKADGNWPQSGSALADTVLDRASRTQTSRSLPAAPTRRPATTLPLEQLRKLSYCEAVIWIGWKLADALAHAHERGILHRDIKPANVLLTDDGQPMLLDFNLAVSADSKAGIGGTPAYMAPEQLAAMKTGLVHADPRSDLYSLGLVLMELLVGAVPKVNGLAGLTSRNPQITPSVNAIIRKCLAASPADRYDSARDLAEDLERQLTHRPLLNVREPSLRERLWKWKRRHPALASSGMIAGIAAICILLLTTSLVARERRLNVLAETSQALEKWSAFQEHVPLVMERVTMRDRGTDATELDELLNRYDVLTDPDWHRARSIERLPEATRRELDEQIAELLQFRARLEADRAAAIRLNEQAATLYATWRSVPRSVWQDRYEFARALGRESDFREWHHRAAATPPDGRDWYQSGLAARDRGEHEAERALFERAVEADPRHYWSWLMLGDAYTRLGLDGRAEGSFDACIALQPNYRAAYYNRGLCRHRLKRYEDAIADFTRALALSSTRAEARIARGISLQAAERWSEADKDFTQALEEGTRETRVWFLRAEARAALERAADATADRAEGKRREPRDEVSFIARAMVRSADGDVPGGLADLEAALRINTRSYAALMNKANLLDEKLHREADAVAVLDRLIECHPQALVTRSGRAVLLARLGRRDAARADAAYCLAREPEPVVRYQLAGVFARLSSQEPSEAAAAFRLLRSALRAGAGHEWFAIDPDLAPIRNRKEFRELGEAVRILAPSDKK